MAEILFKELSFAIIGAAMEVHRILGPGYLEAVYQAALAHELTLRGIQFEQLKRLPVTYKGVLVGDYEADCVVAGKIILELKAISNLERQPRSSGAQLFGRDRTSPGAPSRFRRPIPSTQTPDKVTVQPRMTRIA